MLDDDRIGRLLIKLTIPAFFGMFVMTLYNVVDTIFIGHYVGAIGIAGLSIVFPIQMLAMGMGQMTGMGGASLISRLIGGGQTERAELALGNSLSATFILSALVLIIGLINPDFWLRIIGASDNILPYARDYLVIILFGMIFMTLGMALNGLVRSEGNANVAMVGVIIGAPHRGVVRRLRRSSGPRLRRRPGSNSSAPLYQLGCAKVGEGISRTQYTVSNEGRRSNVGRFEVRLNESRAG